MSCVERKIAAGGDADLLQDEVDVGDHFGHRMLDLNARIHFDEIELAVLVEKLDGADAEILDLAHRLGDGLADLVARGGIEGGGGAFLPDFLMPALQRAVALAEMDGAALAVAEDLNFDVARPLQIFLEIKRIVAECGFRLGARRKDGRSKIAFLGDQPHAAPAAAGRRLERSPDSRWSRANS